MNKCGILFLAIALLSGCSKYDSFVDCMNSEVKPSANRQDQMLAFAYCKKNYKLTDEDSDALKAAGF